MECAEHQGRAAIGICRACMRGVCSECAAPQRLGLACRGRCEADVAALAATLEQSIKTAAISAGMLQHTPRLWVGLLVVALAVGVGVFALGFTLPQLGGAVSALGLPFLAIGALVLLAARRIRKP